MAEDLADTLTGAKDSAVGAAQSVRGALDKYVGPITKPITDAMGLTGSTPLPSQGYNRDGTPPSAPVKQTPTGLTTIKNFGE